MPMMPIITKISILALRIESPLANERSTSMIRRCREINELYRHANLPAHL